MQDLILQVMNQTDDYPKEKKNKKVIVLMKH